MLMRMRLYNNIIYYVTLLCFVFSSTLPAYAALPQTTSSPEFHSIILEQKNDVVLICTSQGLKLVSVNMVNNNQTPSDMIIKHHCPLCIASAQYILPPATCHSLGSMRHVLTSVKPKTPPYYITAIAFLNGNITDRAPPFIS